MAQAHGAGTHSTDDGGHDHPGERQYINIAIFLALVTLAEVIIYYVDALSSVLVPMLVVLSAVKFVTVVGYFMHLKFDDSRLRWIFAGGLAVAVAVFVGLFALQNFHKIVTFVSDLTAG